MRVALLLLLASLVALAAAQGAGSASACASQQVVSLGSFAGKARISRHRAIRALIRLDLDVPSLLITLRPFCGPSYFCLPWRSLSSGRHILSFVFASRHRELLALICCPPLR